jgi:hypothetical protein
MQCGFGGVCLALALALADLMPAAYIITWAGNQPINDSMLCS